MNSFDLSVSRDPGPYGARRAVGVVVALNIPSVLISETFLTPTFRGRHTGPSRENIENIKHKIISPSINSTALTSSYTVRSLFKLFHLRGARAHMELAGSFFFRLLDVFSGDFFGDSGMTQQRKILEGEGGFLRVT